MRRTLRSPLVIFGIAVVSATALALVLVPGLISTIFSKGNFMPHVHCYLDDPRMVLLQGVSDFLIGLSYMVISGALAYMVSRTRRDIPYEWMFLAFGIFIFSCGWTHFLEVWTLYHPTYWLSGGVKAVTAAASLATAVGFIYLLPYIVQMIKAARESEQRGRDLATAHAKLETAYKDLETFSYSLSHDIKGPLRAVNGMTTLVLEDYREKLEPDAIEMLERAVVSGKRMEQLVQDVLALSRLTRTGVTATSVDTDTLVQRVVAARNELQEPAAEVVIESPLLPVWAEEGSMAQCMDNLLGNAVKFVAKGVKPKVHVRTERNGKYVRVIVEDNGIGIAQDQQRKIFEAFQRLHHQSEYEGTGVGLAIVKKGVERMGGRIGVESEPGKGSRFWIELDSPESHASVEG